MSGNVPADDPHVIADMQAAIDKLATELKASPCPGGGYTGQPENEEPTVENCLKAGNCGCSAGAAVRKATGAVCNNS